MDKGIKAKTKSIPPSKKIWGARENGSSAAYRVGVDLRID